MQRMLIRPQAFDLIVTYKSGKDLHIVDALSRPYLQEQTDQILEDELEVNLLSVHLQISEEKLIQFKTATAENGELLFLVKALDGQCTLPKFQLK